jgi:hypothetical protein
VHLPLSGSAFGIDEADSSTRLAPCAA